MNKLNRKNYKDLNKIILIKLNTNDKILLRRFFELLDEIELCGNIFCNEWCNKYLDEFNECKLVYKSYKEMELVLNN